MTSGRVPVLTRRAVNRATLARQHLLRRTTGNPLDVVEHLAGLQAQAPFPPYYGLCTRIDDFRPDMLAVLLESRVVVRIATLRGTVHLHSARDAAWLRPLVQPVLERQLRANAAARRAQDGLDTTAVTDYAARLLADRPHSGAELGPLLAERWPDREPAALALIVRALLPLVQVPPRAVWGKSGRAVHTTLDNWLGRPLDPAPRIDDLVLRYLGAFGPATVRDVQTWSGLTRLREIVDRLADRVVVLRGEDGSTLYDLPDAPRPDPETPAPPRFLPEYDNLLLSHADRSRVLAAADQARLRTRNGVVPGTVLVDGFVGGTWTIDRTAGGRRITVTPFRRLSTTDLRAVEAEARRLHAVTAPTAATGDPVVVRNP